MTWIPVIAAFGVVAGMLSFLAYCSASFDAEARKVEEFRRRNRNLETA